MNDHVLLYAGDPVLLAENPNDSQWMLARFYESHFGLSHGCPNVWLAWPH